MKTFLERFRKKQKKINHKETQEIEKTKWDDRNKIRYINSWDFPHSSVSKESACSEGDPGSVLDGEDPLEKEMATHSSILACRFPWTEEPGGL